MTDQDLVNEVPERRDSLLTHECGIAVVRLLKPLSYYQEKYGTPLGAALRVMAKENRDLRLSAAEKKAAALPAKLTVPMIVFFLPVLFLAIMGPAAMRIMDMQK